MRQDRGSGEGSPGLRFFVTYTPKPQGTEVSVALAHCACEIKTACKDMLKRGKMTAEEIAEDTGLSLSEVEQLASLLTV